MHATQCRQEQLQTDVIPPPPWYKRVSGFDFLSRRGACPRPKKHKHAQTISYVFQSIFRRAMILAIVEHTQWSDKIGPWFLSAGRASPEVEF